MRSESIRLHLNQAVFMKGNLVVIICETYCIFRNHNLSLCRSRQLVEWSTP